MRKPYRFPARSPIPTELIERNRVSTLTIPSRFSHSANDSAHSSKPGTTSASSGQYERAPQCQTIALTRHRRFTNNCRHLPRFRPKSPSASPKSAALDANRGQQGSLEAETTPAFRKGFVGGLKRLGCDEEAVECLVGHFLGLRGLYTDPEALPLVEAVKLIPPTGETAQVVPFKQGKEVG